MFRRQMLKNYTFIPL